MFPRFTTAISCGLICLGSVHASSSWDRFQDIPGARAVQNAQATNRRLVSAPRVALETVDTPARSRKS